MNSAWITLSFIFLSGVAGTVAYLQHKITSFNKIPYTVLLVLVGMAIAGIARLFGIEWMTTFQLTPDLLFFVFLPILIFEAAYHVEDKSFYQNIFSISLLAIGGLLLSTIVTAFVLYGVFYVLGIHVPIILLLLFGSVISATDPVGVLALFKKLGTPERLNLLFEGESLFNDATAVAVFAIFLTIIKDGSSLSGVTVGLGVITLFEMMIFGVVVGYFFGQVFSWIVRRTKKYEYVTLLFMILMAHATFLLVELANEFFHEHDILIAASPIIATTIASLYMGNTVQHVLNTRIREFSTMLWKHLGFISNSLVFLLVGVLVIEKEIFTGVMISLILIAFLVVTAARFGVTYGLLSLFNFTKIERPIPRSWKILLSWASIRGALSIIVILTVPENITVPFWNFPLSPYEFLVSLTIGVVTASLIGKTVTVPWLTKKLKINTLDISEIRRIHEAQYFINLLQQEKLKTSHEKGYIDDITFRSLSQKLTSELDRHSAASPEEVRSIIQHYAYGIEQMALSDLHERGEIDENIFIAIYKKISDQEFLVDEVNTELSFADRCINKLIQYDDRMVERSYRSLDSAKQYLYHRALSIMARKACSRIEKYRFFQDYPDIMHQELQRYRTYQKNNLDSMKKLQEEHVDSIDPLLLTMGEAMLRAHEHKLLHQLTQVRFIEERLASQYHHCR